VIWDDKILDELDKDELEMLCNPINLFNIEEDEVFYFFVIVE